MTKTSGLKQQAIALTAARLFEAVLQLLIPIILIRFINTDDFGMYRFFWLVVNSIMIIAPLGMPSSLLYFIPNLDLRNRNKYIAQTMIFLFLSALVFAAGIAPWNIYLPDNIKGLLVSNEFEIPLFVFLWIVTNALDFIPNSLQENIQQALITIFLTIARGVLILSSAAYYGDFHYIIISLLIFVIAKYILLTAYLSVKFDVKLRDFNRDSFRDQFRYSLPFGLTSLIYALRRQSEQWIVAFLFSPAIFGSFSLAAMILLPFDIIRSSISNVILPKMAQAYAQGENRLSVEYNKLFNLVVNVICFPLLVYVFIFCNEIVFILFGEQYENVIPVLRIYLVQLFLTLEVGNLMRVLEQGKTALKYNAFVLPISITISYVLSNKIGISGAAVGGVTGGVLVLVIELIRISKLMRTTVGSLIFWADTVLLFILAWLAIVPAYYVQACFSGDINIFLKLFVLLLLQLSLYLTLLIAFGRLNKIKTMMHIGTVLHG